MASFSNLKSAIHHKFELYKALTKPKPARAYVPAILEIMADPLAGIPYSAAVPAMNAIEQILPGSIYSILNSDAGGVSLGYLACADDAEAITLGLPVKEIIAIIPPNPTAFNPAATQAAQTLWMQLNKAVVDNRAQIQKQQSAENLVSMEFRNFVKANQLIQPYIGTMDIDNMTIYQIITILLHGRVLIFGTHEKINFKNDISKQFILDKSNTTKATLQLESFLGIISDQRKFAEGCGFYLRSEEILECLKLNFGFSTLVSKFYHNQKHRNGLSTFDDIITAMRLGIANFDDDNTWRNESFVSSEVNLFANNADTLNDADSDDSSHVFANAVKSTIKKTTNKKKGNSNPIVSKLVASHPEAFCIDHSKNGKQANHSNQACLTTIMMELRNDWYLRNKNIKMTKDIEQSFRDEGMLKAKAFPPPK